MKHILHIGLHPESRALLQENLHVPEVVFEEVAAPDFSQASKSLQEYEALLIGEEVGNPIRLAQEAYGQDKTISILLLNDEHTYQKVKHALQFSPFVGPTVQCLSNAAGKRMAPMVEDALQRTAQRRSFARLKTTAQLSPGFTPNVLEKVRADFTTKVLEQAPIGAMLITASGIVLSINNYALSIFNRSEKEVMGTPAHSLFPELVQDRVRHYLFDGHLHEPKQVFEVAWLTYTRHLELSVSRISDKHAANYKLLMLNDVTAAVEAQQRTQAHLEELEKLNANLARVNADLDTFVYAASHDLKSPILNIEGLVASLEHELGPAHERVALELEHIKRSVARFKQTVEDLTEVSRIQRTFEEEAALVGVAAVLDEVTELLEREFAESGATLEADVAAAPVLFFSKRNLSSILYNLVSNAIRYRSPERQPCVRIKTWRDAEGFYLRVQDNGLGIPADKQHRIFQLFKRMHSHTKGSGVGLYIVKRIIDNNGGSIRVQSEEGEGTVFEVKLTEATT